MKSILRIEHFLLGSIAMYVYFGYYHYSWLLFMVAFFVPDVSMLGYLVNTRIGARVYNGVHSLIAPCILFAFGWFLNHDFIRSCSLILFTHVFMDRALGFGLKYDDSFQHTHLSTTD